MGIKVLNNNQCAEILNSAFAMSTGSEEVGTLNLSGIIDRGADPSVIGSVEQFTKALMNVLVRRIWSDAEYRGSLDSPFWEDEEAFGAIIECVSIDYPEVTDSKAWTDFSPTVNSETGEITYVTIGTYEVRPLGVTAKHYGATHSWELPYSYSLTQFKTAFRSEADMREYIMKMAVIVKNALTIHLENLDNMNRNALMASVLAYNSGENVTGVHKVNLVEAYQKSLGTPQAMTAEEYLNSVDGMRFGSETFRKYISYTRKPSTMFNTASRLRFVPDDRMVVQILEEFKLRMERVALTEAFNTEFANLPLAKSQPFWEGFGDKGTFDEVSKISVKLTSDGSAITQSGIVGIICDKYACIHTIVSRRNVSQYFEREDIVTNTFQFTDRRMIDDTQTCIVFTVEDFKPSSGGE